MVFQFRSRRVDKRPRKKAQFRRLRIFTQRCDFNGRYPCKRQHPRNVICPLQDEDFLRHLDFYFMGGQWDEDQEPDEVFHERIDDPAPIPKAHCKQVALWFDEDFRALDAYCHWKGSRKRRDETEEDFNARTLGMRPSLCKQFRRAWCRYYIQTHQKRPRPLWMLGLKVWRGKSIEYQRQHGILHERETR